MKKLSVLIILAFTSNCGGLPPAQETSPGSALPSRTTMAYCKERDTAGRCKDWSSKDKACVNPKGINEPEPIVLCDYIINGKYSPNN